jgi:hypothetical protein
MRRSIAGLAAFAFVLTGASATSAQICLKADSKAEVTIEGTLATVRFVHPGNGSRQSALVVRLAKPVCADVTNIDDKVERVRDIARVQLAGTYDGRRANRLMGKRAVLRGTLFGQHTAYHVTPILIDVRAIEAAK